MRTSNHITLNVQRDSVCAGDDAFAPHAKRFKLQANETLSEALSAILADGYLGNIANGEATWIVEAEGEPVAVLAQHLTEPKFLIHTMSRVADCVKPKAPIGLFFRYWGQIDPAVVFECLKSGGPLPDEYSR
jgi:hypothetical protein